MALLTQLLHLTYAQHIWQCRIHTSREPIEAAANVDGHAGVDPDRRFVFCPAQALLHVDTFGPVARPGRADAIDPAICDPAFDLG